jgi:phosphatidylglycerol:prolipoprotein diacylglycerol transferase
MLHILFSGCGFEVTAAPVFAGLAGLAAFLCLRSFRRRMGLSPDDLWDLVLALVLGVIGGALLFYAAFYNGGFTRNLPVLFGGRRIPGGSFWGSFWAALAFTYAFCRIKKIEYRPVADAVALSSMLALSIMRVGCFLHGCCYGAPTALPWGVRFTDPRCSVAAPFLGTPLHPSQLYESLGSLVIFLTVYFAFYRAGRLKPGGVFVLATVSYSILRFFVDFARGGDRGLFFPASYLTTAQIIAILSAAGSVIWYRRK